MNKPFSIWVLAIFLAGLSCSKKESPRRPTSFQAPTPVFMEVQGPSPTPSLLQAQAPALPEETVTPEALEYVVENIKGKVLILSKGTTVAEPVEEEETVEGGDEIITQAGAEADLTLNENTMFHLSENGQVKISQLTPNDSKGFLSRLELLKGKILCEVEKLKESRSTFEVESGGVVCGVRGTAFEVFKEGTELRTSTFHGEVEVKRDHSVQRVKANQLAVFAFNKRAFLPPRALSQSQRNWYQNTWSQRRTVIRERRIQRMEVLHSINNLPPAQRAELFQNLRQVRSKNRLRTMHQFIKTRRMENNGFHPKDGSSSNPQENGRWNRQNGRHPGKNLRDHSKQPERENNRWDNRPQTNLKGAPRHEQGGQPSANNDRTHSPKDPGASSKPWERGNRQLDHPKGGRSRKNLRDQQSQDVQERNHQSEKAAENQPAPENNSPLQKLFQGKRDRSNRENRRNGGIGWPSRGQSPNANSPVNSEKKNEKPNGDRLERGQSPPDKKQKPADLKNLFQKKDRRGKRTWEKTEPKEEKADEKIVPTPAQ